ncbi:ABC transporter permease [Neoactinobaculum massilliense]|uniref:ABC transporter permease n=1 Tax=Neoactinobaculum massilliense TaxID=2364794 RepID=UPI001F1503C2|nr:ABC transporter permease [Neoactinobaculum massilliense]
MEKQKTRRTGGIISETTPELTAPAPVPAPGDDAETDVTVTALRQPAWARLMLSRPGLPAAVGTVIVYTFFLLVAPSLRTAGGLANVADVASLLGIMAVGVSLLMIGGEFDLSSGVATGFSALVAVHAAYQLGLNVWAGGVISLLVTLAVGLLNGVLLVRTKLPSFIVTLGTMFALQGLDLAVTKLLTGQVIAEGVARMDGWRSIRAVFGSTIQIGSFGLKVSVIWWIVLLVAGSLMLTRTRLGNWIFAVGGDPDAARASGVPVARVKIFLFLTVSFCAWVTGMIVMARTGSVQANLGVGLEFEYIIAAVIGGCLMTGGAGSVVGGALGALIFGLVKQGIPAAQWDYDWYKLFLGVMLLAATIVNEKVRRSAQGGRK